MTKRCTGIAGWLFGHKFWANYPRFIPEFHYEYDYCTRCGMPKGGWRAGAEQ